MGCLSGPALLELWKQMMAELRKEPLPALSPELEARINREFEQEFGKDATDLPSPPR